MSITPLPEAKLTRLRALRQKKMREKYDAFIVEGARLIEETVQSSWNVEFICIEEGREFHTVVHSHIPVFSLSQKEFADISLVEHSQGVLAVAEMKHTVLSQLNVQNEHQIVVALDSVRDPGNVGTVIRSADWFGASAVLLSNGCAELYNPKTIRATMGSIFRLPVVENVALPDAIHTMKENGFLVWALAASGKPFGGTQTIPERLLLLTGSEATGISDEVCSAADGIVAINKYGYGESLNAAMATTAALAMIQLQRDSIKS